ncbi:hypothetical protein HPB50_011675 [Hyalomma asiaticum]|uniref:Uncharacterized protein n=1 Tax=Hyalomma asiaticum TaxID=266040 RepID=A0ACB7T236_HYAAI|nr:hypothetical protein HPB50_011675 [Hyalomma asiaticum]
MHVSSRLKSSLARLMILSGARRTELEDATEESNVAGGGGTSGGGGSPRVPYATVPTAPATDATAGISTETHTSQPALPPSIPKKPLDPKSMICTLGESFNRTSFLFPDDGICTLIFYDSLYSAGGFTLAPPYPDKFQYFLEGSRRFTITESGIGFDYE